MFASLLLATLTLAAPTPSPAPSWTFTGTAGPVTYTYSAATPSPATTPAPPPPPITSSTALFARMPRIDFVGISGRRANSCAHRILCGPIRIWPRTVAGRERLVAQIIASLLEARAWSAQHSATSVSVPIVDGVTGLPTGASRTYSRAFAGGSARSFALSLGSYLAGDAIEHAAQSVFRMSAIERSRWASIDAIAAVGDATRWSATFRAVAQADRTASACQVRIASVHAVVIAQYADAGPATVDPANSTAARPPTPTGMMCAPFFGSAFLTAFLGASPSLSGYGVLIADVGPAKIPRASLRWSDIAIAAQAVLVPTAHALHNIGPIRIIPRDLAERRAFFADAELAVLDGLITMGGTHGNPAREADPLVAPFVRGGFSSLAFSWAGGEILQRSLARMTRVDPARLDYFSASSHLAGIASWLSPDTYGWGTTPFEKYDPVAEGAWMRYNLCGAATCR